MKISISSVTIGRLLGVLILFLFAALVAYLTTAWVWWELNPGAWPISARAVSATVIFGFLLVRWLAANVSVVNPSDG